MPTNVTREEVQRMLAEGAQLVDALPPEEYEREHIAGAVNVHIRRLNKATTALLDKKRPVIVYCHDTD